MTVIIRRIFTALALLVIGLPAAAQPVAPATVEVSGPSATLVGAPFNVTIRTDDDAVASGVTYEVRSARGAVLSSGALTAAEHTVEGIVARSSDDLPVSVVVGGTSHRVDAVRLPAWVSILPPLIAIALALIFREVVISLFAGVWLGAFLWTGLNPLAAILRSVDTFALPALADSDHAAIIIFSLLIGGMVGIIGKNGGTHGIVNRLTPYATTPRRGLLATYAQGLAIFFDDYANTLIVGNTMRPVTDRLRISREKLAYIVDSTAAPIASIMFVSTWVGYEISLIADGLRSASLAVAAENPALAQQLAEASAFNVFIDTIPYRFYPLLALVMVFLVIWSGRDLGPMHRAEARAATGGGLHRPGAALMTDTSGGALEPREGTPLRFMNAVIPIVVVVGGVLIGLYYSGLSALGPGDHSLRDIFGEANSFHVLLWASLLGCIAAVVLTLAQRIMSVQETIDSLLSGMRSMMLAMIILVLAWSLQGVTDVLGTAAYLSSMLEGNIAGQMLPVLVFVVAAAVAFATGTSWGTMAILLPLVVPLGATLSVAGDFAGDGTYTILLGVISSVLAGSIFGDHCSPISDTTVLSSMASACDHMDHVRTQLPYALLVAVVGMAVGDIPTAFGMSPWISLTLGVIILWIVLRIFGRKNPVAPVEIIAEPLPGAAHPRAS
jgi:Na+/H+ antiporter NhaC